MLFAKTVEQVYEIGLSHSLHLQLEEVQMKQAPLKKKKGEFAHSPTGGNGSCAWLPAGGWTNSLYSCMQLLYVMENSYVPSLE